VVPGPDHQRHRCGTTEYHGPAVAALRQAGRRSSAMLGMLVPLDVETTPGALPVRVSCYDTCTLKSLSMASAPVVRIGRSSRR